MFMGIQTGIQGDDYQCEYNRQVTYRRAANVLRAGLTHKGDQIERVMRCHSLAPIPAGSEAKRKGWKFSVKPLSWQGERHAFSGGPLLQVVRI